MLLGVPKSVREWTFTLSSEFPCWELKSQWILESSKRNCKGQNPSAWRILYIIGNLSKPRCLKWAHITHLDIWNTNYDQQKVRKSNWQFDSWPLNVGNRPDFLVCKWHATYHWRLLTRATTLLQTSSQSEVFTQSYGNPTRGNFETPTWESHETKCHLDVVLVERRREYYKGEGGGFPQVWAVVSLVSPSCPWLILAPKVLQLCTNHLVLVLCRSVWVIEACQFFLVPSRSSSTPLYLSKVLRAKERAPTPCFSTIFLFGTHFWILKVLGVRQGGVLCSPMKSNKETNTFINCIL
jgi:hypothetical protein